MNNMDLQERIKNLREDNDLKQATIADVLGISQQVYSGYETGKHELPTRHLVLLADYYKVSTDYLLCRTNYPGPTDTLDAAFLKDTSFGDFLANSTLLNSSGRKAALDYVIYLKNKQK